MKVESFAKGERGIEFSPIAFLMETDIKGVNRPIALHLTLNLATQRAWWGDTTRGHSIKFTTYEATDERVILKDDGGHSWTFTPLTLKLFNDKAIKHLNPLERQFSSDEEVQTFYSETLF